LQNAKHSEVRKRQPENAEVRKLPAPKRRKIKNPDAMDSDDEFFPPEGGALPKRKKLKPKLKRKKPKQKPKPKPVKRKKKPKTDKKTKPTGIKSFFKKKN